MLTFVPATRSGRRRAGEEVGERRCAPRCRRRSSGCAPTRRPARTRPGGDRRRIHGNRPPAAWRVAGSGRLGSAPLVSRRSRGRRPPRPGSVTEALAMASSASGTPAIIRPSTSREVSGGTMPTIRPRYITAIRSARATTSSSSVETMSTAVPRSRSATSRWCMNSIAPTSTPRVGWMAISSRQRPGELAGQHDLLLVAAGQRRDRCARPTGCGCRTRRPVLGVAAISARSSAMPLANGGSSIVVRGPGSRPRVNAADEPVVLAVLGDVARSRRRCSRAGSCSVIVLAVEQSPAGVDGRSARAAP